MLQDAAVLRPKSVKVLLGSTCTRKTCKTCKTHIESSFGGQRARHIVLGSLPIGRLSAWLTTRLAFSANVSRSRAASSVPARVSHGAMFGGDTPVVTVRIWQKAHCPTHFLCHTQQGLHRVLPRERERAGAIYRKLRALSARAVAQIDFFQ